MSSQGPVTPVDGIPPYSQDPYSRGRARRQRGRGGPSAGAVLLSLAAAAILGVVVGAIIGLAGGDDEGPGDAAASEQPAQPQTVEIEPASVESFDPVGGSGFRDNGDGTWSTQTYTTAAFGQLKEGVGLLLDLGEPREVSTVAFDGSPGLSVALLAGDEPPSGGVDGLTSAETATTGEGGTTLSGADAGAHRYWMVWVTELAPSGDGFAAQLSTPVVEGSAG